MKALVKPGEDNVCTLIMDAWLVAWLVACQQHALEQLLQGEVHLSRTVLEHAAEPFNKVNQSQWTHIWIMLRTRLLRNPLVDVLELAHSLRRWLSEMPNTSEQRPAVVDGLNVITPGSHETEMV